MNLVVIISDTFRWDHLGCYGNRYIRTPCLDRLAKKSVVFERCYACSFPTVPARADILTGRWTYTYMGWEPITEALAPKETTLVELLRQAGYHTKAVADTPMLVRNGMGYDRGFLDFESIRGQGRDRRDVNMQRRYETDYCTPATMVAASKWLARHYKEKFLLYIDTWDPHEPWDPPRYYVEQYYPEYDGRIVGGTPDFLRIVQEEGRIVKPCYGYVDDYGLSEEDVKTAHATYCGEVTMVDRWIGFLLEQLEAVDLMDDTVVLFTSDHGYMHGEHGIVGKSVLPAKSSLGLIRSNLYEEVAHIPLIVYIPGVKARRIDSLVSLPDVMPTILELGGAEIPDTVQARSIVPLIEGERESNWDYVVTVHPLLGIHGEMKPIVKYENELRIRSSLQRNTVTSDEWTFIYSIEGEPAELYHLPSDPKQEKNLVNEHSDKAQDLLAKYVSRLKEAGTPPELIELRSRL